MTNFQDFFKDQLANIIYRKITKSFEQLINSSLELVDFTFELPNSPIFINYTLVRQPIFGEDYLAIGLDGTFTSD